MRFPILFETLTGQPANPEAQVQAAIAFAALAQADQHPNCQAIGRARKVRRADVHADLYASVGPVVR